MHANYLKSSASSFLLAELLQLFHFGLVDGRAARCGQCFDNLLEPLSRVSYDAVVVGSHGGDNYLLVFLAPSACVASDYPERRQVPEYQGLHY